MGYKCDWMPDWSDKPIIILASGPSAKDAPFDIIEDRARVIAVNNSWTLYPRSDALFACDYEWYKANRGAPDFAGLKITSDNRTLHRWPEVKYAKRIRGYDTILVSQKGVIGWGGNSGFQAINLAVHMGAKKIILIGFDMRIDKGLHWHGRHEGRLSNPTTGAVDRWRRVTDAAYAQLSSLGISAYNCSPVSELAAYPKVSLEEALDVPHYNRMCSQVGRRIQSITRLDLAKKCAAFSSR